MNLKPFLLGLICLQNPALAQQVFFVNVNASGANNGSSWADAFTHLNSALQSAAYGDQIWVAEGVYLPTSDTDREKTFLLPVGVQLLGGFVGNETEAKQRNPLDHPSVLSGEIGDPNTALDNVFHVVVIVGGDSLTQVDGFKIVSGNADGQDDGGLQSRNHGGGILVLADGLHPSAQPVIHQCVFEKNRGYYGGALALRGDDDFACVPKITHCAFAQNRAEYFGGAIYKTGINLPDQPFEIRHCRSQNDRCKQIAGGIAIINSSGVVRLQGCAFIADTGRAEAGALYLQTVGYAVKYEIDSCDFTANYSLNGSGGIGQVDFGLFTDSIEIKVTNSSFFLNTNTVGQGGGIASYADSRIQRIMLIGCYFSNNFSQNGGGGIWIEGGGSCYTEIITDRCFFLGNLTGATSIAGAFYYRGFSSTPVDNKSTITNSVFMYNSGAVACLGGTPGITDTRIANCSFYRNGPIPFLKYWNPNLPSDFKSTMQILNSVIWEPEAAGVARVFYNYDPNNLSLHDYFIDHCLIHLSSCAFNGEDPCHEGMIYAKWPEFIDSTGQIGLIPFPDNPGLNKGSNAVADTFNILKDYQNTSRVYCDTVDIGAYEIHAHCYSDAIEATAGKFPLTITILNNPVSREEALQIALQSAESQGMEMGLLDLNGRILWQKNTSINAFMPERVSVPLENIPAGLLLFWIRDGLGMVYARKVVVY